MVDYPTCGGAARSSLASPLEASIPVGDELQLAALEAFAVDNAELERLNALIARFNIFEALGVIRQELRHSDFLAFLLDPRQSHGLGDEFAKRLLQAVARAASGTVAGLSPLNFDLMTFDRLVIQREWRHIDILLSDDYNRLVVIIENKVDSSEHSNQLVRYWAAVAHERPDWRIVGVYLTPDGDPPSDDRYVGFSYSDVCRLVESLLPSVATTLDPGVRIMLDHYSQMLRRHIVAESEVADLCRQIYAKHRAALDLIFEHRPDRQSELQEFLVDMVMSTENIVLEDSTKYYIRFTPDLWHIASLSQGGKWLSTRRIIALEFKNNKNSLDLDVVVGPGPERVRQSIIEMAISSGPPFRVVAGSSSQSFRVIYRRPFLGRGSYGDVSLEDHLTRIRSEWGEFTQNELPHLTSMLVTVASELPTGQDTDYGSDSSK